MGMGISDSSKPNVEKMENEKNIDGLTRALDDERASVRREAAIALGRIGDARAVEPLIQTLKDQYDYVRREAAYALGIIGDARAVEPLIQALGDEDSYVRGDAAEALAKVGKPAIEPLTKALKGGDSRVRDAAKGVLGKIMVPPPPPPPPSPTIDASFVNRCLTLQYQEDREDRNWGDIPEMRNVASLGNAGRIDEATRLAESLLPRYPDHYFVYYWLGYLGMRQEAYDNARAALGDGLKKCRSKHSLCQELGEIELKARNLPEAVYWWTQSILLQNSVGTREDYNPFLYLAYVAQFLGLSHVASELFQIVDSIRFGQVRLSGTAASDLRQLVTSQSNESMREMLTELYNRHLAPPPPAPLGQPTVPPKMKTRCVKCGQKMTITSRGVIFLGPGEPNVVKLRCEQCDITRFERKPDIENELKRTLPREFTLTPQEY